jgi:AcrR family transcriptional regulator
MPKATDPDERRARIVGATWQVIVEEGVDSATMRRIAARAGCTTGLVTHYFESKEDILISVVHNITRLAQARHDEARGPRTGLDALRSALVTGLPFGPERVDSWKVFLALWNQSMTSPTLVKEWKQVSTGWKSIVRRTLLEAIRDGEVDPDLEVEPTVAMLVAMNYGLGVTAMLDPDAMDANEIARLIDRQLSLIGRPVNREQHNGVGAAVSS